MSTTCKHCCDLSTTMPAPSSAHTHLVEERRRLLVGCTQAGAINELVNGAAGAQQRWLAAAQDGLHGT